MNLEKQLIDALTTRDEEGIADALMNIANAIHRLADVHERSHERQARSAERFEAFVTACGRPQ
jgi:hypothetical protein